MKRRAHPLDPIERHAADVLACASGRMLALWPPGTAGRMVPSTVVAIEHVTDATDLTAVAAAPAPFDTVASIGQLGAAPDLAGLIRGIAKMLSPHSVLLFSEPTIAGDLATPGPPNDVTGALWAGGLTVFECRRFRARHRLRTFEYCWGRARLTPAPLGG